MIPENQQTFSDRDVYIILGVFSAFSFLAIIAVVILVICLCKYKHRARDCEEAELRNGRFQVTRREHSCEFVRVNWSLVRGTSKTFSPIITRDNLFMLIKQAKIKFDMEFQKIPSLFKTFKAVENKKKSNQEKVRWPPEIVLMYDFNRVRLRKGPSDFIHASYINGKSFGLKRYIITQGPMKQTIRDFWQMVWEQNTYTVIMLCMLSQTVTEDDSVNEIELAAQYWPDDTVPGQEERHGNVSVKVIKVKEYAHFTTRLLRVCNHEEGRSRDVAHFHYTTWHAVDHQYDKVTKSPASLYDFVQRVRHSVQPCHGPPVLHCSAGTGESGLWVATDILTSQLRQTGSVDVYDVVYQLRQQRSNLVHFISQYKYLYATLVESEVCEKGENRLSCLLQQPSYGDAVEKEFECIEKLPPVEKACTKGNMEVHVKKNRFPELIIPFDDREVELPCKTNQPNTDYINASWVDSYYHKNAFIVTQDPIDHTVDDFWRMVWHHNISSIIMLSQDEDDAESTSAKYWAEEDCPRTTGDLTVTLDSLQPFGGYVIRQLTVSQGEERRRVTQYHYISWPDGAVPKHTNTLIDMIVKIRHDHGHNSPLLVHCRGGAERSSILCGAYICMECLDDEGKCNIPAVVRNLRYDRSHMIPSLVEYKFLYKTVLDYYHNRCEYSRALGIHF